MAYKYLEHEADVAIVGIGSTLEEAFQEGARALFDIMIDIKTVEPKKKIVVEATAGSLESLFVEWLNALLAQKDIEGMMFSEFRIGKIKKTGNVFALKAEVFGEDFDAEKHSPKIEVKAATYSGLKIEKKEDKFYAQCICDV